ncbi:MAG: alpha/beta hydrolase [Candidatus Bathyarchaeota archaeon]|nr:alpha/beta hydrolase [Candidatus Bathyarchaeota archaeon]
MLNDLGVGKAHYWGYSYGCSIGFQLLKYHAARFSSYILGAASPYPPQEAEKQLINFGLTRLRLGAEQGPEAVIAFWEKTLGRPESDYEKQKIRGNDYKALLALGRNLSQWPSIGDLLSQIAVPCLLYAGERDPFPIKMKEAAKRIPDARFVSLPGLNHREAFREAQARNIILPHVKRFLTRVS